jgi:hypothetical protein
MDAAPGSSGIIPSGVISNEWNDDGIDERVVPDSPEKKAMGRPYPWLRTGRFLGHSFGA